MHQTDSVVILNVSFKSLIADVLSCLKLLQATEGVKSG